MYLSNTLTNDYYSENSTLALAGPFIRGYINNLYSHLGYAISDGVNVFTSGFGYQVFLNNSESVSLNPTFIYSIRNYEFSDVSQDGILIGCSFEIHL